MTNQDGGISPGQHPSPTFRAAQVPGVLDAEDLAGAAVFFASDDARFVTG